jgi:hypothetical protein
MPKRVLLLTAGVLAAGFAGIVVAGHGRQAARHPLIQSAPRPEITQLSRDERDLIAEMINKQLTAERSQFQKQKVAASATRTGNKTTIPWAHHGPRYEIVLVAQ